MRAAFVTLAVALVLAVPAAAGTSGVRGIVIKSPVTPVCMVNTPCSAPAKHVRLTFVRGDVTHAVTTGDDGRYLIALAPGQYRVNVSGARFGYTPRYVVVPEGRTIVRNFTIDTGIR